ncbi:MAG: hypothetical protein HY661_02465 [Betaproteobacteria bacterium]|nr:hypothetical protein [Betaproteobacteria bacterium]
MIDLRPLPELLRRVRPLYWGSAKPLIPPPTEAEIQAAREILADADPWTRLYYATRYKGLFGDLEPIPHPPVDR